MPRIRVGKEGDFGPEPTRFSLAERALGPFTDVGGRLVATEFNCRHQNADLSPGERDGDVVTCPRHGWRYDLVTGRCLTEDWAKLRRFAVEIVDGEVWVDTSVEQL